MNPRMVCLEPLRMFYSDRCHKGEGTVLQRVEVRVRICTLEQTSNSRRLRKVVFFPDTIHSISNGTVGGRWWWFS